MKMFSIKLGSLCWLIWVQLVAWAAAHPFHTTTAEMEFNSSRQRFEVALKIAASDFERIVRAGSELDKIQNGAQGQSFRLSGKSNDEQTVKYLAHYVGKQFSVAVAGKPCQLEWVGTEDDQAHTWLYFELVLPAEPALTSELTLTNRVLCDLNKDQFNTVVFISEAGRVSLKTHEKGAVVALPRLKD